MIKKEITIPLILLLSLAGCKDTKKQKKSHKTDKTALTLPKPDGRSASEVGNNDILSFFDENVDSYAFDNDDVDIMVADDKSSAWVSEDNQGAISWIESAYEKNGLQTIYFGFNKYGVTKDQRTVVEADAKAVKEILKNLDTDSLIVIEGHACSSAGTPGYNVQLSEKRADYVSNLLRMHGVEASRIKVVGRGQEMPAIVDGEPVKGSREEQWPNRRVEIRVVESV
jgi:outer membrane protein OmpA-like peptidoglycan-associated protein